MTTPEETASAAKTSDGETDVEREVRFAVVMYGGVSLAIYINGVVQELLSLVRATAPERPPALTPDQVLLADRDLRGTEPVYRTLGQLLAHGEASGDTEPGPGDDIRTRFVVDILSGSSAG